MRTPFLDRDDVNTAAFIVCLLLILLALTAVPPEWYIRS